MQKINYPTYDLNRIEREARKMRAEVVAKSAKQAVSWVKSQFVARPKGEHQPG